MMTRREAELLLSKVGRIHRWLILYRLRYAEVFVGCEFEVNPNNKNQFRCPRCEQRISLPDRELELAASGAGIHRMCPVNGLGDVMARTFKAWGFSRKPDCKCDERQRFFNSLGWVLRKPLDAFLDRCHALGLSVGTALRYLNPRS